MIPLSSRSQNLKIVLAVVVLFLGWLIASVIPRNETLWDKTSSAYLARRPVSGIGADGNIVPDSAEYQKLWESNKENYDPQNKNITIDYDAQFFDSAEVAPSSREDEVPTEDEEVIAENKRQWNDEIKIESEDSPDLKIDPPPQWDDTLPIEPAISDVENIAPPLDPPSAAWDDEAKPEDGEVKSPPETSDVLPRENAQESQVVQDEPLSEMQSPGDSSESYEDGTSLFEQSDAPETASSSSVSDELIPLPSLPHGESAETLPTQDAAATASSGSPDGEKLTALSPLPEKEEVGNLSNVASSSFSEGDEGTGNEGASSLPEGDFFALPTKRPAEQHPETVSTTPDSAVPQQVNGGVSYDGVAAPNGVLQSGTQSDPTDASALLSSYKTLTPSNADQTRVQSSSAVERRPVTQVTASLPTGETGQARAAYYEEPKPMAHAAPMAVSIYTAGPGENWDGIAEKFGLSSDESARFAETNSFRLNPDRTVTEGMKLILPKR